jgi:lipopolysaccharide export LptBFGC system permease protein LptF
MAGSIPHYAGAWAPSILLAVIAFFLFKREASE